MLRRNEIGQKDLSSFIINFPVYHYNKLSSNIQYGHGLETLSIKQLVRYGTMKTKFQTEMG